MKCEILLRCFPRIAEFQAGMRLYRVSDLDMNSRRRPDSFAIIGENILRKEERRKMW